MTLSHLENGRQQIGEMLRDEMKKELLKKN